MKLNFVDEPPRRKAMSNAAVYVLRFVFVAILFLSAIGLAWWVGSR